MQNNVKRASKMTFNMLKSMGIEMIGVLLIVSAISTVLTKYVDMSKVDSVVAAILAPIVGSITIIPAFAAFPLAKVIDQLIQSTFVTASFVATLTMVGIATFPIEKKFFGKSYAIKRNLLSFVAAVTIAAIMHVIIAVI